jgi:hypothetical protein
VGVRILALTVSGWLVAALNALCGVWAAALAYALVKLHRETQQLRARLEQLGAPDWPEHR